MKRKYDYACSICLSDNERFDEINGWEQIHFSPSERKKKKCYRCGRKGVIAWRRCIIKKEGEVKE